MTGNGVGRKQCKQISLEEKCKILKVDKGFLKSANTAKRSESDQ
jgi:Holliday junction resolvasome RuvABC DNA-binding subunit